MENKGRFKKAGKLMVAAMCFLTFSVVIAMFNFNTEFVDMWLIGFPALISLFLAGVSVISLIFNAIKGNKNQDDEQQENSDAVYDEQVKVCKYCGAENDLKDRNCHSCGAALKRKITTKKD